VVVGRRASDQAAKPGKGSHKPGKPGIVREFCKPGKVREIEIWSANFFLTCHMVRDFLIDELIFACNV